MRCIYSWTKLNEDEPPNAATRSKEHIVSWAIGGSNGLVTYDVCKKWNNDFGSLIDEPFANTLPIAIKRHELKIKGSSGTIPPIVWQLRSTENNEPANLVITADGDISFIVGPVVIDEEHSQYTKRLVTGSPDIVKGIFGGMLQAAKAKNRTIYSPSGDVIERWEDALATAEIEVFQEFAGRQIVALDFVAWNRGMFKIALGLGHLVLGSDWTFSASADCLRAVLANERKDWPLFKGINPPLPPEIVCLLGIDQTVRNRHQHTLIVLPGHEPTAIMSLFGGSVPQFAISLGNVLGNFGSLERMPPKQLVGFRVDPTSRTATRLLVEDLCRFRGIL